MAEKTDDRVKLNTLFLKKDEYLFRQHDNSQELYIIKKGCVRIFKTEGQSEIELDMAGAGMVIGEIASIDGGCRSASAVAIEDSELSVISAEDFALILDRVPEYLRKIAQVLVHRLREVDEKINRSVEGDCTNHIAALIMLIASSEWSESADNVQINRKFLENELMDLMNISPHDISSKLDWFEKEGLVSTERGRVILTEKEKIETLAKSVFKGSTEIPVI